MQLPNDPIMLMSVINLKLRDFYSNLDALCDDMNMIKRNCVKSLLLQGLNMTKNKICSFNGNQP